MRQTGTGPCLLFSLHLLRSHCPPVCLSELSRHRVVERGVREGGRERGIILTGLHICTHLTTSPNYCAPPYILQSALIYRTARPCPGGTIIVTRLDLEPKISNRPTVNCLGFHLQGIWNILDIATSDAGEFSNMSTNARTMTWGVSQISHCPAGEYSGFDI